MMHLCLTILLLILAPGLLNAQFGGGTGDGAHEELTGPVRVDGLYPVLPYQGGAGDGEGSAFHQTYLDDQSLEVLYTGAPGDGSDVGTLLSLMSLSTYQTLFAGGVADGHAMGTRQIFMDSTAPEVIFAGGMADGAADDFQQTWMDQPGAVLFSGGTGDGFDGAFRQDAMGGSITALFDGGIGDGHDFAHAIGVELPATLCTPGNLLFVNLNAQGTGGGQSWTHAMLDLQLALAHAGFCPIDTVWVAEGMYYPTGNDDRQIAFEPPAGVDLLGGFNGTEMLVDQRDWTLNETILSGEIGVLENNTDNSIRILDYTHMTGTAILDGFIIEEAFIGQSQPPAPDEEGAGIWNAPFESGQNLVLRNLVIRNCVSVNPGAALFHSGPLASLQLSDSVLEDNSSNVGGILNIQNGAVLHLLDDIIIR